MEQFLDKSKCSGCSACMSICPKGAIEMVEDLDGFKYPVINQDKCINCGLCKKTCPIINTSSSDSINECYVGFNNDKESLINMASSGSIFELVADYVLDLGGIVVGAAFENNKLKHIAIEEKKDLVSLKGSKYVQSDLNNIFKYIKENINDRKILFVGTPCQVAGLKSIVRSNNLICVDIVCHGVPTPKLFDKYIKYLEDKNNSSVVNYNFRDKKTGWDTYSNTIVYKDKSESQIYYKNDYMKLFLSNIALRESCYDCNFKLGNKYSDITLGDFWGVKNIYPEMYNKNGVSAIIINTLLGREVFNSILSNVTYKKCNLDDILKCNSSLEKSCCLPKNRKDFFEDLNNVSFDVLSKKYIIKKGFLKKIISKLKIIFK